MTNAPAQPVQVVETFAHWCNRRGVWPPMTGISVDESFRRLGDAFVEYLDSAILKAGNAKLEAASGVCERTADYLKSLNGRIEREDAIRIILGLAQEIAALATQADDTKGQSR